MRIVRARYVDRLSSLQKFRTGSEEPVEADAALNLLLKDLEGRKGLDEKLSLAGFVTRQEQKFVQKCRLWFIVIVSAFSFLSGLIFFGIIWAFLLGFAGIYFATSASVLWISLRKKDTIRSIYYELPLVLEELVLLVESGLALFPALEEVCVASMSGKSKKRNTVVRKTLRSAYQLAAYGMPMSQAFEQVAKVSPFTPIRHVMLHLDISSSVGGELLYSLQALSEQVHREWKLSVETRIKKLENLVVFPVFLSVIGLMVLIAAVPMVPILDFMSSMKERNLQSETSSVVPSSDNSPLNQGEL